MKTIAFTGHRPKDLPIGFGRDNVFMHITLAMRRLGLDADLTAITFVTGGALGIDTWAADYALDRGIALTLITPFTSDVMTKFWSDADRERLEHHIEMANEYIVLGGHYNPGNYQRRNEAMVNRADILFAFWTGKPNGGTANCINYATRVGRTIRNLLPGGPEFGS